MKMISIAKLVECRDLILGFKQGSLLLSELVAEFRVLYSEIWEHDSYFGDAAHIFETQFDEFAVHPSAPNDVLFGLNRAIARPGRKNQHQRPNVYDIVHGMLIYRDMDDCCEQDQYDLTLQTATNGIIYKVCETESHYFDLDGNALKDIDNLETRPSVLSEIVPLGFPVFQSDADMIDRDITK